MQYVQSILNKLFLQQIPENGFDDQGVTDQAGGLDESGPRIKKLKNVRKP